MFDRLVESCRCREWLHCVSRGFEDVSGMGGRVVLVRTALAIVVTATVLFSGVGAVAGWWFSRDQRYGDASVEAGFARDMSTHHSQAVELGMLAHARSPQTKLGVLGGDIALTQHGQIGTMQAWLREWGLQPTGEQPAMAWMSHTPHSSSGLMPGMASREELDRLRAASGRDFEVLWAQLMLRHHLGGIEMAEAALQRCDDEDVRWLAGAMKAGQQSEINALEDVLNGHGAKPL
ncbi:DUF305 domain-containing protein [Actinoplanes sp. NBC_00393]|uniref:DUF305 domain-containing protein n=1 Tax=Actinoplanes sp. NBC_00393 TaxID=2975953 RepID=UPI002E1F5060